jgi:multiple antibiotic resistance protein
MFSTIIAFLAMLNPFALFLYLSPLMKELEHKTFLKVLAKASIISLIICIAFFFIGTFIFESILQIHFESFRIFGGIIIFSFAYLFIVKGQKAFITLKTDLDDLASEIALPFMVGAGTISLSILINEKLSISNGLIALLIIFIINFLFIYILKFIRGEISKSKFRKAFDKNMEILLRINGFLVGAIGIDMIITGINNLFIL